MSLTTTNPKVTFSDGHQYQPGDVIVIVTPDHRKWPRFKAWLLGRPYPSKKMRYVCKDVVSSTVVEIGSE